MLYATYLSAVTAATACGVYVECFQKHKASNQKFLKNNLSKLNLLGHFINCKINRLLFKRKKRWHIFPFHLIFDCLSGGGGGSKLEVMAKWWREAAVVCLSNVPVSLLPAASPATQQTPLGLSKYYGKQGKGEARKKEEERRKKLMLWLGKKKAAKPCL